MRYMNAFQSWPKRIFAAAAIIIFSSSIVCFLKEKKYLRHQAKSDVPNNNIFDMMHKNFYVIANGNGNGLDTANRKKFYVGAVNKTGGGLFDSDSALLGQMYYDAKSVFEFGLGESTAIAAYVGVPRYFGVDSDASWLLKARESANADHFRYFFADIGDTRDGGNPVDPALKKAPMAYQTAALNSELEAFDVYFVDGRYRVACVCASFSHAMSRGGDMSKVMVAVHDWDREYYHVVLTFSDISHKSDSDLLAVLKLKPGAKVQDIFKVWADHMWEKD